MTGTQHRLGIDAIRALRVDPRDPARGQVRNLHIALGQLGHPIADDERKSADLGPSTRRALRAVQANASLPASGRPTAATVTALQAALEHGWYADNKSRVRHLQQQLRTAGYQISDDEHQRGQFGASTGRAVQRFQRKAKLEPTGLVDAALLDRVQTAALTARLRVRTQRGKAHKALVRAARIARLEQTVHLTELSKREFGPTTTSTLQAFQSKYQLPVTGQFDAATMAKVTAVAASQPTPIRQLKPTAAEELSFVQRSLRLNMQDKQVPVLQRALAFFGYAIDVTEYSSATYGKTTREAVLAFQRSYGLAQTGSLDTTTMRRLNAKVQVQNGAAPETMFPYRVRGTIRDDHWKGIGKVKVGVYDRPLRGTAVLLGERVSGRDGFFDVPYTAPTEPATGQPQQRFHIDVVYTDVSGAELARRTIFNPTLVSWANHTLGDLPYRGASTFEAHTDAVLAKSAGVAITALQETESQQDITQVALESGLNQDDVMRLVLSYLAAAELKDAALSPAVFFAFIRQNLPPGLPGTLLAATDEWTLIGQLVDQAVSGIVLMDPVVQASSFDAAVATNLVPIAVARAKDAVLAALAGHRQQFALQRPLLIGKGSLGALLAVATAVPATAHLAVADAFLAHGGITAGFWNALESDPAAIGGDAGLADVRTTIALGRATKNHVPTVQYLRGQIDAGTDPILKRASDVAKLATADWVSRIKANGSQVPAGTDGGTTAQQVQVYAATLTTTAQRLYPSVALAAEVGRSKQARLPALPQAADFIDQHGVELRRINVDGFIAEKAPGTAPEVTTTLRVLQRVGRLSGGAGVGRALLEAGLHSSAQIVALGRQGLATTLGSGATPVDSVTANTVYGLAQFQYAQVLQRLTEYRFELYARDPQAIVQLTYTEGEQTELAGQLPDLATLFGSLDYCDCADCQSVYSPAAYLADVLRFLSHQPATTAGTTVADVLLARRPDIGTILLNCANTETPVPYIDLVCEILENRMPPTDGTASNDRQTTRSADELRAYPEHLRAAAYDTLRTADFPINSAFDLYEEDARLFLDHLGVPRSALMRSFQRGTGAATAPSEASIAAEGLGISTHEATLITTTQASVSAQTGYWGLDASAATVPVSSFLDHAHVSYAELMDLLACQWVNPRDAGEVHVERPADTCDLDAQTVTGLSAAALDRMHRFLRLWRHGSWQMWQLDLLLRAPGVGNGRLDSAALGALCEFADVVSRLKLTFEPALAMFGQINTEVRPLPGGTVAASQPLYATLFQNRAVLDPIDAAFSLPIAAGGQLVQHRAALRAALSVSDDDLDLLLGRVGPDLSLDNLSALYRLALLARATATSVVDTLALIDLCAGVVPAPFAGPAALTALLTERDRVRATGFAVAELGYVLRYRPDSPYGVRDEVIVQYLQGLRDSLRTNPAADPAGQIAAQVAVSFGVTPVAAIALLGMAPGGQSLLAALSDPALTARAADGSYVAAATEAALPAVFRAYRLLHKATLVVRRLRMSDAQLSWLLAHAASIAGLDLATLPVAADPPQPPYAQFRALVRWLRFAARHPQPGTVALSDVADLAIGGAAVAQLRTAMSDLTGWSVGDLTSLDAGAPANYLNPQALEQWDAQADACARLGVTVATALAWADRDNVAGVAGAAATVAAQVRQTARSKYEETSWNAVLAPLEDVLRQRKRDGLVAYLVEQSVRTQPATVTVGGVAYPNALYWRVPDDMLRYFLVDVETQACALTSRIKLAMGAVQTFVQRCLMNLERPDVQITTAAVQDASGMDAWSQWQWMQSYSLWQANRQVFLYPENWLDPTLRDDKTPFFVELEQEILQGELTSENCEAAFGNYLQKLREVARLKIVGVYHEVDDDNPDDALQAGTNVLHVIGRTVSDPAKYFYRTFDLNYQTWTPWSSIDLDIVGDHVVPVVYNRHLHLFWLVFAEKAMPVKKNPPAQPSAAPTDPPEPPKVLEIQLAWSVHGSAGWSGKQTGPAKLVHPWQRPASSYNLKPRYKSRENQLWLDVYISTSREFNNTQFFDPYSSTTAYVTAFRADETARPWHASSFVFDGNVVAIRMKALRGWYHVLDGNGIPQQTLSQSTSYQYVRDTFGDGAKAITPLSGPYEIAPRLMLPDGMHFEYTRLTNNTAHPNPGNANILQGGVTSTLLQAAQAPFELAFSQHHVQFDAAAADQGPLVYQDPSRTYLFMPRWRTVAQGYSGQTTQQLVFDVRPMFHPYSDLFLRELNRSGLGRLFERNLQNAPGGYYPGDNFNFAATYHPTSAAIPSDTAATDVLDFSASGAYSTYNWEVFFHAPLLIASKLQQNQRFEEAMQWYHYIFDPTNTADPETPRRYWITKPFYDQSSDDYRKQRIEQLLQNIGAHLDELRSWRNNPYNPDLIARMRPVAYQKSVVMRYIDNLIAWGDQLFGANTLESINQATLRYVLAAQILGRRPESVPPVTHADKSYDQLVADGGLDPFGNAQVDVLLENYVSEPVLVTSPQSTAAPLPTMNVLYFGIPYNEKLLGYWDVVADRLFKIRNCMNIGGAVEQLPLFEPPIDPAILVQARAAGVDLGSILSDVDAPVGVYRFRVQLAKAIEVANETRLLGDRMLALLERKDAEGFASLLASNEVALQTAIRTVRTQQIDEAQHSWAALTGALAVADRRIEYFGSVPRMNAWETAGTIAHGLGIIAEIAATVLHTVAGAAQLVPSFTAGAAGFGGSPVVTVTYGGGNVGGSASSFGALFQGLAGIAHSGGQMLEMQGRYTREFEMNQFQRDVATLERTQLTDQAEAARLRYLIAQQELANLDDNVVRLQAVAAYLTNKYTSEQLYDWLIGQLSTLYFQSYQLAYETAKRAERCLQFELATTDSFIQFGYWDSLKRGLLAGDRLAGDLRRMEAAYLARNARELELSKNVSLAQYFPLSLLALKTTGACTIELPEWLFDLDHPGHYRRRLKSVGLSVPAVAGPFTNVNATLTMTRNAVRLSDDVTAGYGDPLHDADGRFATNPVPMSSIATSHGTNDRGMFEVRLDEDRYLPFEGAGAVSEWSLSLPRLQNQFDLATLSDVVLHVDYTAVAGGLPLATAAADHLEQSLPSGGTRLFVLDEEFATAWYRMLHADDGADQTLSFTITAAQLPFWVRARAASGSARVHHVDLILDSSVGAPYTASLQVPGEASPTEEPAAADATFGGLPHLSKAFVGAPTTVAGEWQLKLRKSGDATYRTLQEGDVRHAYLVVTFAVEP